jgi:hypothetical protein
VDRSSVPSGVVAAPGCTVSVAASDGSLTVSLPAPVVIKFVLSAALAAAGRASQQPIVLDVGLHSVQGSTTTTVAALAGTVGTMSASASSAQAIAGLTDSLSFTLPMSTLAGRYAVSVMAAAIPGLLVMSAPITVQTPRTIAVSVVRPSSGVFYDAGAALAVRWLTTGMSGSATLAIALVSA